MKTVLALISLVLFTQTAFAAGSTRQDLVRTAIAGEIVSVKPLCPISGTCVTDGTVIEFQFQPQSECSEISVNHIQDDKSKIVEITAIETVNMKMACVAVVPEPQIVKLSFIMMFPPFVVNFFGTNVTYNILPEDVDYN